MTIKEWKYKFKIFYLRPQLYLTKINMYTFYFFDILFPIPTDRVAGQEYEFEGKASNIIKLVYEIHI